MNTVELLHNVTSHLTTKLKGLMEDMWIESSSKAGTLLDEIEQAKQEWINAQNYFQNVTDPALVDHAVYLLEAAEVKYQYLLRQARSVIQG